MKEYPKSISALLTGATVMVVTGWTTLWGGALYGIWTDDDMILPVRLVWTGIVMLIFSVMPAFAAASEAGDYKGEP